MSFTSVVLRFGLCSLASGDDADDISVLPLAVTHQQKPCVQAHAQKDEAVFSVGVLFVKELQGEVVVKDGLGHL